MGEEHVMHGAGGRPQVAIAGGMHAEKMAEESDAPGFVDGGGSRQAIAELFGHQRGVVGEPIGDIAVHPAAAILQGRGKIPVIKGGIGFDAPLQHAVDQAVVEIDAGLVDGAGAFGDQARPGKGEAIGVKTAIADQVEIGWPELVVIAGIAAGIAIVHIAGRGGEAVPDALATAIALPAFDLIGSGGNAKGEIGAECPALKRKQIPLHGGMRRSVDKPDSIGRMANAIDLTEESGQSARVLRR